MNKFFAAALSTVIALSFVVQTPSQAHAGAKEKALVTGLVVGAAAAALVYANTKTSKKSGGSWKQKFHANDDCGPGYFWKNGKCRSRGSDFQVSSVSKKKKFSNWQLQAIRKGCAPGLAWSKQEGCHEND